MVDYGKQLGLAIFGEVPKMAEGTPLERVQVVNSGARVQIPPSPLVAGHKISRTTWRTNTKMRKQHLDK